MKDAIGFSELEEHLLGETSVLNPDDVPALMESIRKVATEGKPQEQYELIHIWGLIEPSFIGPTAKTWDEFEAKVVTFLKRGEYNPDKDGLFFLKLDGNGKPTRACAFSSMFMDQMKERAEKELNDAKAQAPS